MSEPAPQEGAPQAREGLDPNSPEALGARMGELTGHLSMIDTDTAQGREQERLIYREMVGLQGNLIGQLTGEIEALTQSNEALTQQNGELTQRLDAQDARIADLEGEIAQLREQQTSRQTPDSPAPPTRVQPRPEAAAGNGGHGQRGGNGGNGGNGGRGGHENNRGWGGWRRTVAAVGAVALAAGAIYLGIDLASGGHKDGKATTAALVAKGHKAPNAQAGFSLTHEVADLNKDGHSIRQDLQAIQANPDQYKVHVSHVNGAQAEEFIQERYVSNKELALGSAIASISDQGYRASYANELQGIDAATPRSDSAQDQMHIIWSVLLDPNTSFRSIAWNGWTLNHGAHSPTDVFDETEYLSSVRVLQVTPGEDTGLQTVYIKAGGGQDGTLDVCLNFVNEHGQPVSTPVTIPAPGRPSRPAPTTPPSRPPHKHHHQHHRHHPNTGGTPPYQQIKVAEPLPAGKNHADHSPGTPSGQEPTVPTAGVGPDATPVAATTTPPAAPTYPENNTPAPGEPTAPVNVGNTSNGDPTAPGPGQGQSTQSAPGGGQPGQGGAVSPNAAPVAVTTSSTS